MADMSTHPSSFDLNPGVYGELLAAAYAPAPAEEATPAPAPAEEATPAPAPAEEATPAPAAVAAPAKKTPAKKAAPVSVKADEEDDFLS